MHSLSVCDCKGTTFSWKLQMYCRFFFGKVNFSAFSPCYSLLKRGFWCKKGISFCFCGVDSNLWKFAFWGESQKLEPHFGNGLCIFPCKFYCSARKRSCQQRFFEENVATFIIFVAPRRAHIPWKLDGEQRGRLMKSRGGVGDSDWNKWCRVQLPSLLGCRYSSCRQS